MRLATVHLKTTTFYSEVSTFHNLLLGRSERLQLVLARLSAILKKAFTWMSEGFMLRVTSLSARTIKNPEKVYIEKKIKTLIIAVDRSWGVPQKWRSAKPEVTNVTRRRRIISSYGKAPRGPFHNGNYAFARLVRGTKSCSHARTSPGTLLGSCLWT